MIIVLIEIFYSVDATVAPPIEQHDHVRYSDEDISDGVDVDMEATDVQLNTNDSDDEVERDDIEACDAPSNVSSEENEMEELNNIDDAISLHTNDGHYVVEHPNEDELLPANNIRDTEDLSEASAERYFSFVLSLEHLNSLSQRGNISDAQSDTASNLDDDTPNSVVDMSDFISRYQYSISEMLNTSPPIIKQFWDTLRMHKLAVIETKKMYHPFHRVPYTKTSHMKLDLVNRTYKCNLTEEAFRQLFVESQLAQDAVVCPDTADAENDVFSFGSFLKSLSHVKSVARKFARRIYNLAPKDWVPVTHGQPPAYTTLESIIQGWLVSKEISERIVISNASHTLPHMERLIRSSFEQLKSDEQQLREHDSYVYSGMHSGYNWLLSIKAIQDRWLPTWQSCLARRIPGIFRLNESDRRIAWLNALLNLVFFLHLVLFCDAFAAFSTKQKSLCALIATTGEFEHGIRSNGSLPTLMLQSIFQKHHKANADLNRGSTNLNEIQLLLNLEYESLNRGKLFYNAFTGKTCCLIAVEHCVLGDGPGKAEYCKDRTISFSPLNHFTLVKKMIAKSNIRQSVRPDIL